jgi:hypothetical protein
VSNLRVSGPRATRNIKDFAHTCVELVDLWSAS